MFSLKCRPKSLARIRMWDWDKRGAREPWPKALEDALVLFAASVSDMQEGTRKALSRARGNGALGVNGRRNG